MAIFLAVHHGRTLENRLGGVAAQALIGAPSAEPEGKGRSLLTSSVGPATVLRGIDLQVHSRRMMPEKPSQDVLRR